MMFLSVFLIFMSVFTLSFWLIGFLTSYFMHLRQTKQRTKTWDYGTFENFQEQFKKYDLSNVNKNLFMNVYNNSSLCEYWTEFNGNGMVFSMRNYYYYLKFIKSTNHSGKQQKLWNGKGSLKVVK